MKFYIILININLHLMEYFVLGCGLVYIAKKKKIGIKYLNFNFLTKLKFIGM